MTIRTLDIARDDRAPRKARHALDELAPRLEPSVHDDARLLISELVANAVRHGDGDRIRMMLDVRDRTSVRCEVIDQGSGFLPIARPADSDEVGGWGLQMVESLSKAWGVRKGSTHVWFELERPEAA